MRTHKEKRLHLVLVPRWHLVDVDDRRVSAARDPTMLLDCLEYIPAVIAVALISREPERDKQRFDRFRSFLVVR
jgi:hypothetical protein